MKRIFALCMVLLAMTACKTKRGYVEKGNALFDQGKYPEAALNYRKAIQKDPNYADAYYHLALTTARQGDANTTYNSLLRAWRLDPNNVEIKKTFAAVCLEYYMKDPARPRKLYDQLNQLASELLAQNPESFDALRVKGYLAHEDRKPGEAISYFRRALSVQPSDAQVTTALVQTLLENGQFPDAEKIAVDLISRAKTYGQIYDVLYSYYSSANRTAEAESILKLKVANNPRVGRYVIQLARHYARVQKTKDEQETIQKLLDNPQDFPNAKVLVGDFYLAQKDYKQAIQYYEAGTREFPKESDGLQKRAMAAMLAGAKYDDAMKVVDQILARNPKDEIALRIRADLLINTGKPENGAVAVQILRNLQNLHPNEADAGLLLNLGRAYNLKGDLGAARTEFEQALIVRKNFPEAQFELGKLYLTRGQPVEALQAANAAAALRPNDRHMRLLQAWSLANTGQAVKARVLLEQLMKEYPNDDQVRLQLGLIALRQANYREAINFLQELPKTGPAVVSNLAAAYIGLQQYGRAQEVLSQALKLAPGSEMIMEQIAETNALSGNYGLAASQLEKLIAEHPKSANLHLILGEVYLGKGQMIQALEALQKAHDLAPTDSRLGLVFADALSHQGKYDQAKAVYRQVVQAHPDDLSALNNAAYFLSDHGDLDEAQRLAEKAVEKAPGQPSFADTLGYIYLKKGQRESAIRTFGDLVRRYPTFAAFHYHLGLALYQNGESSAAKKELQKALAGHPGALEPNIRELLKKVG